MAQIDESTFQTVANTNFKVNGEAPSMAMGLAYQANALSHQNAVSNQQHVNTIASQALQNGITLAQSVLQQGLTLQQALLGKLGELIITTDIAESGGLGALLQQLGKIANTTPPETGRPTTGSQGPLPGQG